ncbi:MAG: ABC transporter substrate-binding protein [Bacillota bacterium]|nr:ABC transporter substrate-binding protein [Bacillota bacterium]
MKLRICGRALPRLILPLLLVVTLLAGCSGTAATTTAAPTTAAPETTAGLETEKARPTDDRVWKIGISQYVEHNALDAAREGFLAGLARHGISEEAKNLDLRIDNAQNDASNANTIADQYASADLDLILAIATPSAQAMANAVKDIPILVTAVTDPAASGIVASNDKPGGNVSGTSDLNPVKEQMALISQLLPDAKRVAIMYAASEANSVIQGDMAEAEAAALGLETETLTVPSSNELQQVVQSAVGKFDAIYLPTDNLFAANCALVGQIAIEAKLPVITGEENMMQAGGLATVSLDYYRLGEQTADMAAKILLEGAVVGDMPIEYQTNAVTILNQVFADAIGYTFPADLLETATVYTGEGK